MLVLKKTWVQFPEPNQGALQEPVTSGSGFKNLSFGLCGLPYACVHHLIHIYEQTKGFN